MTEISLSNQQMVRNTIYLNMRLLVSLVLGLYSSRIVLQVLGVEDFGLYSLIGGFVSMLTILTGTFSGTASRFITYEIGVGNREQITRTTVTIINLLIGASIFVFIVGTIIAPIVIGDYLNIPSERLNAAYFVYFCSLVVFSINLWAVPYQAVVIAHEHMGFYALVNVVEALLKFGAVLLMGELPFDYLYYYALSLAIISLLIRLIFGIYCSIHFEESRYKCLLDKRIAYKMFSFSAWMGFGTASGIMKDQIFNIIINLFWGLALNAARGIANQVTAAFNSFTVNIGTAISPQITISYGQGNIDRSIKLTFFSAKLQGYVALIIIIPILLELNYLLTFWLGEFPPYTISFVSWGLLAAFVQTVTRAFVPLFLAVGKIRNNQLIGGVSNFIYVGICYVCCLIGFDAILCLQLLVLHELLLLFYNYYCLKLVVNFPFGKFLFRVLIPMFTVFCIAFAVVYLFKYFFHEGSLFSLIISLILSLITILPLVYLIGLEGVEKEAIQFYFMKVIRKKC